MIYIVEIVLNTRDPLTMEKLEEVAAIGGSAGGTPGQNVVDTGLTVRAKTPPDAAARAIEIVTGVVPGRVESIEIMTEEEQDRRLAGPPFPRLVGVSEVASMLGVSRQRLAILRQRHEFPAPVAELAAGPIWRAGDLSTFASGWRRQPGRPKKQVAEG
jgi:hypothetical protein